MFDEGFGHLVFDQGLGSPCSDQGFWHPVFDQGLWHPEIQFCTVYRDKQNTVLLVLSGQRHTVLQFGREKRLKTHFGPKYSLTVTLCNPDNPVVFTLTC